MFIDDNDHKQTECVYRIAYALFIIIFFLLRLPRLILQTEISSLSEVQYLLQLKHVEAVS
jgi:hypothetical protein